MHSPVDTVNVADPGDAVQRNFRYQHAYGVVLLLGAATGKLDYKAVWCEQQEDLLGEVDGRLFDAYQVKTQKPERGYWQTLDDGFSNSIRRFCDHETLYPGAFRCFTFVSNTACLDSEAKDKEKRSPVRLIASACASSSMNDLGPEARMGLAELAKAIERTENVLFSVLKKTKLLVGPSQDAFIAELALNHVPHFKELEGLTAARLQQVVFELMGVIAQASALASKVSSPTLYGVGDDEREGSAVGCETDRCCEFHLKMPRVSGTSFQLSKGTHVSAAAGRYQQDGPISTEDEGRRVGGFRRESAWSGAIGPCGPLGDGDSGQRK